MNPLEQYKNTKTAIHCPTEKEAKEIGKLIAEMGGKDVSNGYVVYETKFCLGLSSMPNCMYCDLHHYKTEKFKIIPASEILNKEPEIFNNYQIF